MRNIELAYLFTACAMIGMMIFSTQTNKFPTFSHIATGSRVARQAFFWGLLIAGLLFGLLMYKWFIPHFHLGNGFRVLTIILVISQMFTGLFSVEAKYFGKLHVAFGSLLALSMVVLLFAFTHAKTVPSSVQVVDAAAVSGMLLLAVSTKWTLKSPKQLLLHEYLFFGLWHAAILITAYIA
jgi:hypothetical protein